MASLAVDEPEIYGRFLLLSRLGTGGMAELWAARPRGASSLPGLFALKRMLPADACRPEFVAMFVDEAKVIASLDHPNIARSYEYGQHGGLYYIAMELVRGLDLRRVELHLAKKNERIPMVLSVFIIEQVCLALAHAHATKDATGKPLGLIHRDITPHNLMLGFDGSVKVIDFGIAKTALQSTATRAGTLKGKVHYMSPEQARGDRVDRTCDLYAASICLWELLAGREAFERDETYLNALQRAQEPEIPKIRELRDDVPEALAKALDKGLALDPRERFQSGEEMADALSKVRDALGGGGRDELARWLRARFARIWDAQGRVLSRVGPVETGPGVDVEASTIRGVAVFPRPSPEASEVSGFGEPTEGTEVFYSVDVDVELPQSFEGTMPYAPLLTSGGKSNAGAESDAADAWADAPPTEVDDAPGFDLEDIWVAFGTEAGASDGEPEIPIEHDVPDVHSTQTRELPLKPKGRVAREPEAPARASATDPPPPPPRPARRSSGLVIGVAVILAAAIVGAAVYLGPLGRPDVGRIEIDAEIDEPFHVTVDGRETGIAIDGLAPGPHEVAVSAEGYELLVRTVEVTPGATTIVATALRPIEALPDDAFEATPSSDDGATMEEARGSETGATLDDDAPPATESEVAESPPEETAAERAERRRARRARAEAAMTAEATAEGDGSEAVAGEGGTEPPANTSMTASMTAAAEPPARSTTGGSTTSGATMSSSTSTMAAATAPAETTATMASPAEMGE